MINQEPLIEQRTTSGDLLCIGGGIAAAFGLAIGLLLLFVMPGACTFLSGLQLTFMGFLFIAGIISFLLGRVLLWRKG